MQLHYLNFQPKRAAKYEPKLTQLWCLQKQPITKRVESISAGRQASCTRRRDPWPLPNQQAKRQGIKSYFPGVWANHHPAACRLLGPAWGNYLAFCPHFFCCKSRTLASICFPGFCSRFPQKKKLLLKRCSSPGKERKLGENWQFGFDFYGYRVCPVNLWL